MKKFFPLIGFGLLLVALLFGAFVLPKAVQKSAKGSLQPTKVQAKGKFATQATPPMASASPQASQASSAQQEVFGGEGNATTGGSTASGSSAAIDTLKSEKEAVIEGVSVSKGSGSEAKGLVLEPAFLAIEQGDFPAARAFLETHGTSMDMQTATNLRTLIAIGESQERQTQQAQAQAAAIQASQKKLEAALGKLQEAGGSGIAASPASTASSAPLQIPAVQLILFAFDSSIVDEESRLAILEIAKLLHNEPRLGIDLVGMSDPAGKPAYNRELSLRRAAAVSEVLVNAGVDVARMKVRVGDFTDAGDPKKQRRVEIRFRSRAQI